MPGLDEVFELDRLEFRAVLFALPALLTWISYVAATCLLVDTNRYMAPQVLRIAGVLEFAAFFFITVLEAEARWTVGPSN